MDNEKFDIYALVELFGHSRIAGRVTERNFGGSTFLQVDVPETKKNPSFSRFLNPSAVYAINPVDEVTMKNLAESIQSQPIQSWDINSFVQKAQAVKAIQTASVDSDEGESEGEGSDLDESKGGEYIW